jgi:hypothetical protein
MIREERRTTSDDGKKGRNKAVVEKRLFFPLFQPSRPHVIESSTAQPTSTTLVDLYSGKYLDVVGKGVMNRKMDRQTSYDK